MYERLTDIFSAAAIRIVGAADAAHTHPHDVTDLLRCGFCGALGDDPKPERSTPTHYVWVEDDPKKRCGEEGRALWCSAPQPASADGSPECRLRLEVNDVTERFARGTQLLLAQTKVGKLLVIAAPSGSEAAGLVRRVFACGTDGMAEGEVRPVQLSNQKLDLPLLSILAREFGLTLDDGSECERRGSILDEAFPSADHFPSAPEFSRFVREQCGADVDLLGHPDEALVALQEEEERFCAALEPRLLRQALRRKFAGERSLQLEKMTARQFDDILEATSSTLSSLKTRSGCALPHHVAHILSERGVSYTERGDADDAQPAGFILSVADAMSEADHPAERFLASKPELKDDWRKVFTDVEDIRVKYLLTLDCSISEASLEDMTAAGVRLVVPQPYRQTYPASLQRRIITFADFIEEVLEFQKNLPDADRRPR